ncbi:MAG: di-trans,poly-cis-decaprenylcistransferase [Candidatus Nomurabacteria bacterium]|nr:di-trans,poly-cis-decaprenylcistransferase [Candidatus Nomurabacteria bacterium]USN88248.1 MAG: di-trans,poly-cis-decaprenylcistransferase [Candidatus Nomurabacteria bacterium]
MEKSKERIECVGFIMDGNRRFAKERGLSTLNGHLAGREKFLEVTDWLKEMKIPHAVFYAFSTENWKRSPEEVEYLLMLFRELLAQIRKEADERKFNVRVVGRRDDLPEDIQASIAEVERETADKYSTTVWVAFSYGGRAEIIEAVNRAVKVGQEVNEEQFSQLLWTAGMPDPDIIIRTSGEKRLSNFLPWQTVYSEFFFIDTYWPAFTKTEFTSILEEYAKRERRIGR